MKKTPSKMPPGSAWISKSMLQDENLSGNDTKVFLGLCSYANAETDQTFVSQDTLSREFNLSKKTVNTSLQKLEKLRYIKKETRGRKNSRGRTTNIYTILNDNFDDLSVKITFNNEEVDDQSVKNTLNNHDQSVKNTIKSNAVSTHNSASIGEKSPSNKNNLNTNKNNLLNTRINPINMSKQSTLFDVHTKLTPQMTLSALREGKDKSLAKCTYVLEGELTDNELTDLDLCYFYQKAHKEIVGYSVSVNKTVNQSRTGIPSAEYMQRFRQRFNLSVKDTLNIIPEILEKFRTLMELERKKKSEWFLHIGHLTWTGNCYIEKIMRNVKPKVNTKYVDNEQPKEQLNTNLYDLADEEF